MKKALSIILFTVMLFISISVSPISAAEKFMYEFTGNEKNMCGYAEGTITYYTESDGTYMFFWGDSKKELDGYFEIYKVENCIKNQKISFSLGENVAIPAGATQMLVVREDESGNKTTEYIYNLPQGKILTGKKLYSFEALSDIHIDRQSGGKEIYYVNSDKHFEKALSVAKEYNTDFIVSSGDQVTNASGATDEWLVYQEILSKSEYSNPIYECIGNHETRISKYAGCPVKCGLEEFMLATGLDEESKQVINDKPYYEYTEKSGDHFIFMALEKSPDANTSDEFSDEQISWVKSLLLKYKDDGHKIFLIQHSPISGYGAGDDKTDPGYKGTLNLADTETGVPFKNNQEFKKILEDNKDIIWISGHTHVDLRDDKNYSDENDTSCHMIHIPSCCNTTRIVKDEEGNNTLDYTFYDDTTQGYIVDSYDGYCIFNGINFYYDKIYPQYSYVIGDTGEIPEPVKVLYGDADVNEKVNISDATSIQQHLAYIITLSEQGIINAKVDGTDRVSILDATLIQQKLAKIIDRFPVEEDNIKSEVSSTGSSLIIEKGKKYLDAYFQYASYPVYMKIKKACQENDEALMTSAISEFDSLHKKVWADTVYFTDVYGIGDVRAYSWKDTYMEPWPGQRATYIKTNRYSQNVYAVTIDFAKYNKIIFNNNSTLQTADISLDGKSGKVYYATSSTSPYAVTSDIYRKMWAE